MTSPHDSLIPADENRRMFAAITERYDLLNRVLSLGMDRRWRRCAVRELAPEAGHRFLDLGTGTGDLALEIRRQAPGSTVVGIDVVHDMLVQACRKLEAGGLGTTSAVAVADGRRLPFPDVSFSGATSAFVIRNLENRLHVLGEVFRVVSPGGTVAMLELIRPDSPILRLGHGLYLRLVVPSVGRLLSRGNAYRYLARSVAQFPACEAIAAEFREAGFVDVGSIPLNGGIVAVFRGRRPV